MNIIDLNTAFALRRSLAQVDRARAVRVANVPTYHSLHLYLVDVTPEQLAEALRTTTLVMESSHGARVIKRKPSPPDAA
jgi:hypothetical protein